MLTKKLCSLLCFLSGQRSQSIGKLKIDKSILSYRSCTFYFDTVLKITKPGNHQHPLVFNTYPQNSKLCIIDCLQEYRRRADLVRENLDGNPQELILLYAYPFKPNNPQSIARYIKLFSCNGRDRHYSIYNRFHSKCIKANNIGLSIKDIQKAAGWNGSSTFQKH